MNANQANRRDLRWMAAMAARGSESVSDKFNALTLNGVILLLVGLTVFLSGFGFSRWHVFNLRLQPYLIAIVPAMPLAFATRLGKFPIKALVGIVVFFLLYALASIGPSAPA